MSDPRCPSCGKASNVAVVSAADLRDVISKAVERAKVHAQDGRGHGFVAVASAMVAGVSGLAASADGLCERCLDGDRHSALAEVAEACRPPTDEKLHPETRDVR